MANEKVAAFASAEWMEIVEKYEIQAVVGGVGELVHGYPYFLQEI